MAYKVVWSPTADATFAQVIDYLSNNFSEKEIYHFVSLTDDIVQLISKNPFLFRSAAGVNVREALVTPQTLLIYRVNESTKTIQIIAFFDTRQNPKKKKGIISKKIKYI